MEAYELCQGENEVEWAEGGRAEELGRRWAAGSRSNVASGTRRTEKGLPLATSWKKKPLHPPAASSSSPDLPSPDDDTGYEDPGAIPSRLSPRLAQTRPRVPLCAMQARRSERRRCCAAEPCAAQAWTQSARCEQV